MFDKTSMILTPSKEWFMAASSAAIFSLVTLVKSLYCHSIDGIHICGTDCSCREFSVEMILSNKLSLW